MEISRALVLASVLTAVMPWAPPAHAAEIFRCGSHRVLVGEHIMEVLERCGEPDFADERLVRRTSGRKNCSVTEVLVTDWVYDFGLNHYIRYLHFENGFLSSIRSRWVGAR